MSDSSHSTLITGASGLVGRAITQTLDQQKRPWRAISHRDAGWNPEAGELSPDKLDGVQSVIHLAGEPIAAKRWSDEQKKRIRDSRVNGTRALAEACATKKDHIHTLICASAIGIYGDGKDTLFTEDAEPAEDFLGSVVTDWEAAADPAREAGIRVVHLRLGVVLSPHGGALAKMLPLFKLGLGGPIASGRSWMSWVHLADAASAFVHALTCADLEGAFNLAAPQPVRNLEFTKTLGDVLHRPTVLPVPAFGPRLLMGEMADALLQSTRVSPRKLQQAGWDPAWPQLSEALKNLLTT